MRTESMKSKALSSLGIVLSLCFLVNCQRARLEPSPREGGVQPTASETCRASDVKADKTVKVLFVVDVSGSNVGEANTRPSDPNKHWRANTLRAFMNQYTPGKNFYYGLTLFKGTSAQSKINIRGRAGFSNQKEAVAEGYRSFLNTSDTGNTPYKAALKLARSIIAADLRNQPVGQAPSYAVVMISDGQATDYKNVEEVIPDTWAIKNLAPDRITLNSVFYSAKPIDAEQTKYLKSIAHIGEGEFVTANSREGLKLDEIVKISPVACQ